MEEWRVVADYQKYEVSSLGHVRNRETGRVHRPGLGSNGYLTVSLQNETGQKTQYVHRLVAEAFLPPDGSRRCVDHVNGIRTDNRVENLRWASLSENQHNRRTSRNNTSGIPGVSLHKQTQKWQAQIQFNGRNRHLGFFSTREEARAARVGAARLMFGEFCSAAEREETPL